MRTPAITAAALFLSINAAAIPIDGYTSLTQISLSGGTPQYAVRTEGTAGAASKDWDYGTAAGQIDLDAGKVRAAVTDNGTPEVESFLDTVTGVIAEAWEFVEFTFPGFQTSGTIGYDYAVDGSLFNTSSGGQVAVGASVGLYDVTGLSPDDVFSVCCNDNWYVGPYARSKHFNGLGYQVIGSDAPGFGYDPYRDVTTFEDDSGALFEVDDILSGAFKVQEGHQYLLEMSLSAMTFFNDSAAGADFSNTAAFNFTDLDGGSFTSASGSFLSATAPVPEPSCAWLLGAGLLCLLGGRLNKVRAHR